MATSKDEEDPLASIASVVRTVGIVIAALAIILGIIASVKHNGKLGIVVGVVALVGVAVIVVSGQFSSTTYADRLGDGETPTVKPKTAAPAAVKEEKYVKSTNAAEDHVRSETVVEGFRNFKRLPECPSKIKLNPGEVCHYSTAARFEKATNGTIMVTSDRVIFIAQGIFNASDLKTVTQLIKYDSGAVGIASKRSLLPEVYDVSFPGELLTIASLACMARGIQSPPIEHV